MKKLFTLLFFVLVPFLVNAQLTDDFAVGLNAETFDMYNTARDMVILEIGTGTWTQYGPGAALGAQDLVTNGCSVAVIEYHGPAGQDPFATTSSDARNTYYAISAYPTAKFDGVVTVVGGSNTVSMYPTYLTKYQQRKAKNSAFTVGIYGQHSGNDYNVSLVLNKVDSIPANWTNLVVHLVLTESGIVYSWQGQTHLEYVSRMMVPDANGTVVDFSTINSQTVDLNFTVDSTWIVNELELVAFIQNLDGKEILQGTKVALSDLTPVFVESTTNNTPTEFVLGQNYPNPFNPITKISWQSPASRHQTLKIYDVLGNEVVTIVDEFREAGRYEIEFDANNLTSGVYFYRLQAGDYVQTRKMILLK